MYIYCDNFKTILNNVSTEQVKYYIHIKCLDPDDLNKVNYIKISYVIFLLKAGKNAVFTSV